MRKSTYLVPLIILFSLVNATAQLRNDVSTPADYQGIIINPVSSTFQQELTNLLEPKIGFRNKAHYALYERNRIIYSNLFEEKEVLRFSTTTYFNPALNGKYFSSLAYCTPITFKDFLLSSIPNALLKGLR